MSLSNDERPPPTVAAGGAVVALWIKVGNSAVNADEFCSFGVREQDDGWCIVGWLKTPDGDISRRSVYLTLATRDKNEQEGWMRDVRDQLVKVSA